MGDRWGAKKVLLRVVTLWSFFTAATGWAWSYVSLLACRFLFGVGEAGCFPNLAKAFTHWLPSRERVRAQGYMWFAARWGGAITPFLVALLLQHVSWRRAFELFGLLGIVWGAFFYFWYRDDPEDHPKVNAAELRLIREGRGTPTRHERHALGPHPRQPLRPPRCGSSTSCSATAGGSTSSGSPPT